MTRFATEHLTKMTLSSVCLMVLVCASTSSVLARSATSSNVVNMVVPEDKDVYQHIDTSEEEVGKSATPAAGSSIWSDVDFVYRTYQDCSSGDLSVCLKLKLVGALDGAARSTKNVEIIEGIQFVGLDKDTQRAMAKSAMSEDEILATLPRSVEGRESMLSSMIWDKLSSFFQSHTVQIKFTSAADQQRVEGREKDKKHHGYIMIPLLLGSTIIPIAYGALALLAGKALIVSKLALVLASIIGIKKLVSHSGDGGGSSRRYGMAPPGASVGDEAHYGNARGFELPQSVLRS